MQESLVFIWLLESLDRLTAFAVKHLLTVALVLAGMFVPLFVTDGHDSALKPIADVAQSGGVPQLEFDRTIQLADLGLSTRVYRLDGLTYSPDGGYLAIVYFSEPSVKNIIIWDLKNAKVQTRIEGVFAPAASKELVWSPDGRYITFGWGSGGEPMSMVLWNPINGQIARKLAVFGDEGRFNKDGSKLLVRTAVFDQSTFRIYDTGSWAFKDYDGGQISGVTVSWTAEDKVLLSGVVNFLRGGERASENLDGNAFLQGKAKWIGSDGGGGGGGLNWTRQTLDGLVFKPGDTVLRLLDPVGGPSRTMLLKPSVPTKIDGKDGFAPLLTFSESVVSYASNRIAFDLRRIVDGNTLEVLTYCSQEEASLRAGAFSSDGRFLYVPFFSASHTEQTAIVNAASGVCLSRFDGGHNGLASSPDGRYMAVGKSQSVVIYKVKIN
jgi:WD40 repeat protein